MANEKNLIPVQSEKEAREKGKKGGKASGEARRKKRDLKAAMKALLELPVADNQTFNALSAMGIPIEEINNKYALVVALYKRALEVDVAARRAVVTGISQLTARVNEENAKLLDTDSFEVSWHSGARPLHQVWQGRWFTRKELEAVCGLGDVRGLCGANCRHSYYPVIPGISEPTYTPEQLEEMNAKENVPMKDITGKTYTKYEATQRQRRLETAMRADRQKIHLLEQAGANEDDIINARCHYRGLSQEYTRFSEAMGLRQQRQRITVDGLGNVGVGKWKKAVDNSANGGIINTGKSKTFHCYGDHLRDKLGSAKDNNPEDLFKIKESVEKSGGKIIFLTDSVKMVCNIQKGVPGTIEVDENISIAGLMHEYRHFLDDNANGNPGLAFYFRDKDKFFEFEKRGYEEELKIAEQFGYKDIVDKIKLEIKARRREIYGE